MTSKKWEHGRGAGALNRDTAARALVHGNELDLDPHALGSSG